MLYVSSLGADPEPADLKSEASTTGSTTNVKTGRGTAKGLSLIYFRILDKLISVSRSYETIQLLAARVGCPRDKKNFASVLTPD